MRWIAAFALACAALAQSTIPYGPNGPAEQRNRYQAVDSASLTASAETLTIQQVANGPSIYMRYASVDCTVACTVTFSVNGTAATGTALKPVAVNTAPPASATAWKASNVGTGTVLGTYYVAANTVVTFDLSEFILNAGGGTGANISMKTSAITGTAQLVFDWAESF